MLLSNPLVYLLQGLPVNRPEQLPRWPSALQLVLRPLPQSWVHARQLPALVSSSAARQLAARGCSRMAGKLTSNWCFVQWLPALWPASSLCTPGGSIEAAMKACTLKQRALHPMDRSKRKHRRRLLCSRDGLSPVLHAIHNNDEQLSSCKRRSKLGTLVSCCQAIQSQQLGCCLRSGPACCLF